MMDKWFSLNGTLVKNPTKEYVESFPIERRVEYRACPRPGMVIEKWWVNIDQGMSIDFSYQASRPDSVIPISTMRRAHFEAAGVTPAFDYMYYIPEEWFGKNTIKLPGYLGGN